METDPLERIALALVDEIRARRAPVSADSLIPQSSPQPAQMAAAPASVRRKRERRVGMYPEHFNIRIRAEDRDRFDAYADRHRLMKGEVFRLMMDALEAAESEQGK